MVGKEAVLPWKSKTKGTGYWKAIMIDNSEKQSKTQEKETKIQEKKFKTTEEHKEQEDTKKRCKWKAVGKNANKAQGNILEVTAEEKVKGNSADGINKILTTLVGQQGQVLSMLSTLITQTRPAIVTTTQPTENPKSPTSDQLSDNFFGRFR